MRANSLCLMALLVGFLLPLDSYADIKPFAADSLDSIVQMRKGEPFLLVLWSVECPPCMSELDLIGRMLTKHPAADVVIVAVDDASMLPEVERVLASFALINADNWIFADSFAERLRYQIDPSWSGELPRTYFYRDNRDRRAISGALTVGQLEEWMKSDEATVRTK
jgi:thiol-disulfide isomerase/thioredoxin